MPLLVTFLDVPDFERSERSHSAPFGSYRVCEHWHVRRDISDRNTIYLIIAVVLTTERAARLSPRVTTKKAPANLYAFPLYLFTK